MKKKSSKPKVLMEEDGIVITADAVTTPLGDFPLHDIKAADRRMHRPMLGPILLAGLGTLVTVVAFHSQTWYDTVAAGLMLGGGLSWWLRGTRYILTLLVPQGEVNAWVARRDEQVERAMKLVRELLEKRRERDAASS